MILIDTSVWIDHLRRGRRDLVEVLENGQALQHPFVTGELACGRIRNRGEIVLLLERLPEAPLAAQLEALHLVDEHRLAGRGLGWVDVHLLASARLASAKLWSLDRPLVAAGKLLGVAR